MRNITKFTMKVTKLGWDSADKFSVKVELEGYWIQEVNVRFSLQ